ncbi:MAG: methionine adenosyltransferase [Desulfurococcaceae archaeon]|uniref:Methionine adenosyltransferase n=1 Tax=Staphylothermus marinus TaxID=2280 RepID=A0A7C4JLJ2_STAMA
MERNIVFETIKRQSVEELQIEIVERKGLGHPDYIADSASEVSSKALSLYYLKEFGTILHHNLDKTLLVGGQAYPRFGGGYVTEPIYIIVAGRATTEVRTSDGEVKVPYGTLIIEAVRKWIKQNMRYLDPDKDVIIDYMVRKGSADLVAVFEEGKTKVPLANDTSIGVGYAPLSTLEKIVLESERSLNSREYKMKNPAVGEDVKVLGIRKNKTIVLTIACAMIDRWVRDINEYLSIKEQVVNDISDLAVKIAGDYDIKVYLNTADMPEKKSVYLTVTGTSAEHGDDGATGRGNRANGLIAPMRPLSMEAVAGKNPVNHVGKIYNVIARRIANKIYNTIDCFKEVYVEIVSQIGRRIDQPLITAIRALPKDNKVSLNDVNEAKRIADEELNNIVSITRDILEDKEQLF